MMFRSSTSETPFASVPMRLSDAPSMDTPREPLGSGAVPRTFVPILFPATLFWLAEVNR